MSIEENHRTVLPGTSGNRPAPLVIGVGYEDRRERFRAAGFTAVMYERLRTQYPGERQIWEEQASPIHTSDYETFSLDERLYGYELEGRRVVLLAPPYRGPRNSNPADRVAERLREEGARVSIVTDSPEPAAEPEKDPELIAALMAEGEAFGAFRRTSTHTGGENELLIEGVLFRSQNHTVYGGAGQGKTMLACFIASELVKRGETVVYLDMENGHGRIFARMRALGCEEEQLERYFHYFEEPPGRLEDAPDYRAMLADVKPSLIVFDSLFGFLAAADLDENYGKDVARWYLAYAPPTLEAATLILDHPPKNGAGPRGTSRKVDHTDVSWELSGNFSTNHVGPLKLSLKKSRDGGLGEVVTFTFGGTPLRAQRGDTRKLAPHERTLDMLEDGMTAGAWLDASGIPETTFFRHRDKLISEGRVEKIGDLYSHVGVA
jgi:hypothetical protein